MRWSFANRLAKPIRSTRSPAAIRSGQATPMLQTWNPIRIGSPRPGGGPSRPDPDAIGLALTASRGFAADVSRSVAVSR